VVFRWFYYNELSNQLIINKISNTEHGIKEKIDTQINLFEFYAEHEMAQQLKSISQFLDDHCAIVDLAAKDLCGNTALSSGRKGLTAESILRAALLKQMMGLSYEKLSFYLIDSISYRSFTRLSCDVISPSALQANIVKITAPTWERINHILSASAAKQKIEKGRTVRIDNTVTEINIHAPTDSSLLWDCVRTTVRLLSQLKKAGARKSCITVIIAVLRRPLLSRSNMSEGQKTKNITLNCSSWQRIQKRTYSKQWKPIPGRLARYF